LNESTPVLTLYNGNPFVLEAAISTAIMRYSNSNNRPSNIVSHGFEYGTSGAVEDLLNHFGFDSKSIERKVMEILK
jgi:transketolase C-terminal domain/subunit